MGKVLAIFSPNSNAYSETFIQAHKKLPFQIRFYSGGIFPNVLENGKGLLSLGLTERIKRRFSRKFTLREYALYFSLKRENTSVVLAEYGETAAQTLDVVKALRLPLVVHFHGYDASVHDVLAYNAKKYNEVFDYSSAVVSVSKKMSSDLIKIGCPPEKIIYAPYGPNDLFFSSNPTYDCQQFVAIGRFVEKKGPHLTILAFDKVMRLYPKSTLVMVGDGPLFGFCKQIVQSLKLERNVTFTGPLNQTEVFDQLERSLAFVQHSITAENGDSEGTPVAVLEAQAARLPVISTLHAGIPDVVIDGQTGLLCNEKDIEQMAQNMIELLKNKELAKRLGSNGRAIVEQNFKLEMHLQLLTTALTKVQA